MSEPIKLLKKIEQLPDFLSNPAIEVFETRSGCTGDSLDCKTDGASCTSDGCGEVSGVTPWSWNASNGTASAVQTRTAYNAVSNYGPISDFSYLVWNDMVAKVAEMRNRANQKPVWNTKYLDQASTSMSNTESGRTMTAARYNSLRYNIGIYYGFNEVPSGELIDLDSVTKEKVPGDLVIGSDFIDLMTGLNYAIDRANNS